MSRADELLNCEDCLEPADAFSLVGDETRLAILEGLWRLEGPVSFSTLREEVGVRDSAQFNYHLGELREQFVRKTDDGYELRTAGQRVVQAILAGSFTEHPSRDIDVGDPCVRCGAELVAHYDDEMLALACPACGHGHGEYPFPPGGLHDRTNDEVLAAFDQRVRHLHCLAKDGVCPECNGRMHTHIERGGVCCLGATLRADHVCEQCHHQLCSAIGLGLLDHAAVSAFYADHGVTLSEEPYWRFRWCVDDDPVTVRSEDPWRVAIDVTAEEQEDAETLRVVLDGDLTVVETERV